MHNTDNPLYPVDDTPYDAFIFQDMFNDFRSYLNAHNFSLCPEGLTVKDLSLSDNIEMILNFINNYYGNKDWRVVIMAEDIHAMIERDNAHAIGFFWNNLLVGIVVIEIFDVFYKGNLYKAGCGDYMTLHPKFRNKNMTATIVAKCMDKIGELGAQFCFFHTHTKLRVRCPFTYNLYNLSLTDIPKMAGISNRNACKLYPSVTLITPTTDHLQLLNNQSYNIYIKYDEKMLSSMLKYDMIYTDGKTVLRFISFHNVQNRFQIKTAVLIDYAEPNNVAVFTSALIDLREKGFDLVTIINDKNMNKILSTFPFEKNSEMYTYTGNILPKAKINEIHLNVR